MVDAHFAFRAPGTLEDEIRGTVRLELKGGMLNVLLIEQIVLNIFFTNNNPWRKTLIYRFDEGISLEMFGLIVTMVSNAVSNILFYISSGSQVRISLNDWSQGAFDHATPLGPKHKRVFNKILANLQEPGQDAAKLLRKWWEKGM
jgi:hypothetical protein